MKKHRWVLGTLSLVFCLWTAPSFAAEMKEWTFLTYLNGHNNLDRFGAMNMRQMQEVGSTDQLNIVVQWASSSYGQTRRVYVKKGELEVVEQMPRVDMGDYRSLVEFVRWGVEHYPAKNYFVNIWNHGGGWHKITTKNGDIQVQDISWDDFSGHFIKTEELGVAMNQISGIIGKKVDLYGSDACLMAMAEVATEVHDSVQYFVGSEETEPGEGWPYSTFLARWVANPTAGAADVAKMLTEEYFNAYNGGIYGRKPITFSAMDLSKIEGLWSAMTNLTKELVALSPEEMKKTFGMADSSQSYAYDDYKDLKDFVDHLAVNSQSISVRAETLEQVNDSISELVIANVASPTYSRSHGIAVWLPTSKWDYSGYKARYSGLRFNQQTQWLSVLDRFF